MAGHKSMERTPVWHLAVSSAVDRAHSDNRG